MINLNTNISKIVEFNYNYIVVQKKYNDKYLYLIVDYPIADKELSWRVYEIKKTENDIRLFNLIDTTKGSIILSLYNEKHNYLDTMIH